MKRTFAILLLPAMLLLLAGCSSEISVRRVDRSERLNYGSVDAGRGLMRETGNLLANHLLMDLYEDDPEELIRRLQTMFRSEPRPESLSAMADVSLNLGVRFASHPNRAIGYFLSAALYSYGYLLALDDPGRHPYSADRVQMIRIYNMAISEIFDYLRSRDLARHEGYAITAAGGERVTFTAPRYDLPLAPECYLDFQLCANYEPENLTHTSRRFGIGAPLICQLAPFHDELKAKFAKGQTLPATLLIRFGRSADEDHRINARLVFLNSRDVEEARIGKYMVPLELDFSTPLAFMARQPLPFGYLGYMLHPDRSTEMQGLYMIEPYNEGRIPVVLVHGLMSNTRTWAQMLNTLQNDPDLRKYYQFWGFSYSSGNPILYSAKLLREALEAERRKIVEAGKSTAMFDRMVLIGHSMGGLLSKTAIMDSQEKLIEPLFGVAYNATLETLKPEQRQFVEEMLDFEHLPFVKRVVFIAVPHRGSTMAQNLIARLGSSLIELPRNLVQNGRGIIGDLMEQGWFFPDDSKLRTGIDNLDPDDRTLQALDQIPFIPDVPYHSIIGNRRQAGIPGGSDGIVPYASSHLDGARSELVVKSGHSAQQNPLAIQEIRRILLEHLDSYPDIELERPELPGAEAVDGP